MGAIKPMYISELQKHQIIFEEKQHSEDLILNADIIIKSPGIPETNELVKRIRSQNIPIISEIEFAARYTNAFKICITGTDGKTTTSSLIHHMMKKAGLNVGLAGNIGKSFAWSVAENQHDFYVLEISSFQLDDMYDFKAEIAVLTNISADHLDRYDYKIENYIKSKFRITRNQTEKDTFIYCQDNELTTANMNLNAGLARLLPFSFFHKIEYGAYHQDHNIYINTTNNPNNLLSMNLSDFSLKGRHNAYNSMAAGIVGDVLDIRKEGIRESLSDFVNIEHRLENCGKVGGIEFINDSKATNVNAAWYALESMEGPVVWIAGGVDKGNDYTNIRQLVKDKVKIIVCLGLDNRKIHEAFANEVDMMINTTSMAEAVHVAHRMASKGDTVLLSPACASFDLFDNYEDRGREFKKAVKNL
jgi:UDP-N-acetylmuramoylalanine--D-glutamate ligase